MDIYDILTMIGGLCLFLFGMDIMGESLQRAAGDSLRTILSKLTGMYLVALAAQIIFDGIRKFLLVK